MTHPIRPLSARQCEVAARVASGKSYIAIGLELQISAGRARNAVREIADLLPNPDHLPPYRLVANYYGHIVWLARHAKATG